MSFFRSVLLIGIVSLLISGGLLFLGYTEGYEEFRGGYAVLSLDADIDDKSIISLLGESDSFGGDPVGESSLWVLLDNFDSVDTIPLDAYFSKVFSFDPRYDKYAEQLRDVFLRDNKRFIYIPLAAGNWNQTSLNNQFASLLGEVSFSVDYYGTGRPLYFFFIMYLAASLCLIILCYVNKNSHHSYNNISALSIVYLVPVFSPLAFFGASGLGCVSLFFALFILIREPLTDLVTLSGSLLRGRSALKKSLLQLIYKEIIAPYRHYALLLPFFAAAFAVVIYFSQLQLLFLLIVFVSALLVFLFSIKILSLAVVKRKRFSPVLIIKRAATGFAFSVYMMPFAAAAIIIFFLSPYHTGAYIFNNKFDSFVHEQDYFTHIINQSTFSTRQFGAPLDAASDSSEHSNRSAFSKAGAFPGFFFDIDGLPSMKISDGNNKFDFSGYPPFPLKNLMDFFEDVNSGQRTNSGTGGGGEKWVLLMLAIFILVCFVLNFNRKKTVNADFSGIEQCSKKIRQKGINWNKTPLYNERNHKRLMKTGLKL